jgi:hypothetical protein
MAQKPLTVLASGLNDSSTIPFRHHTFYALLHSLEFSICNKACRRKGVPHNVSSFFFCVRLKSAFDDDVWKMEENGAPLRFGLLNSVYTSCDSSFVKLVTGWREFDIDRGTGRPQRMIWKRCHVFELILS